MHGWAGKGTARVLYIPHGAGPMPLLGDEGHREMVDCLQGLAARIPKPEAILLVSAHWEEPLSAITRAANPPLLYDYYGFPPQSYEIEYPASGHPELAGAVHAALTEGGIESVLSGKRGFDHGMFVPLKIMYPEADVPCVQLSLVKGLDPGRHLAMGEALAGLGYENLLIIGSGFSFHNMSAFFAPETGETRKANLEFDRWLNETCSNREMSGEERRGRLENWEQAPFARYCHPREEHLLPLHVCYGAAGSACDESYNLQITGKRASCFLWD